MVQGPRMRIYDPSSVLDWHEFQVKLAEPFSGTEPDMTGRMDAMQEWTDLHCEGEYIILLGLVVFQLEGDALIFKLKYG